MFYGNNPLFLLETIPSGNLSQSSTETVYRCNLNERSCLSCTRVIDHVFVHETVRDSGQFDLKLKCGLFDLVFVVVCYVYVN
jgi:hypothetical protein